MSSQKISELIELAEAPASTDIVPIVDTSTTATKKITVENLLSSKAALQHAHTEATNGGQLDHTTALTNVGTNTHAQIDTAITVFTGNVIALDYYRSARLAAKTVSVAADRYTLAMPTILGVTINGVWRQVSSPSNIDLSNAANWDTGYTTYATAANRAGKDFYVYAVVSGDSLAFVLSPSATYPTGYSATTARKIGGFHCLCLSAGTISGHALTGYVTGDILPASVWDLKHRPICDPEGMVYVEGLRMWVDIYLASVLGGKLVSAYGGTIADGASSPAFDWYDCAEWLGRVGKRLPTQPEFMALSDGSNQGTNISGSVDPVTTGGHSDTASRRMISNVGCEDACGCAWHWAMCTGAVPGTAAWKDQYVASRTSQRGQGYQETSRLLIGGSYSNGVYCGSRGSLWNSGPMSLYEYVCARGVAEHFGA